MSLLRSMADGLRSLFRKERVGRELDEEVNGFLEMAAEEKIKQGMSRKNALRAVRLERGSLEVTKEVVRSAGWESFVETLWQDLRFGLRMLTKSPTFTAVAVLTLALGIAATATLYSILDGAYIHFAQTDQGNRVALIVQNFTKRGSETSRFSPAEYLDFAGLHRSFEGFFALRHSGSALTETSERGENPEQVPVVLATANFFSLNGIAPLLGRVFGDDEDRPSGPNVAVLSYRLWNRRFARNAAIVGKTIKLDGVPYTVIGVTPRGWTYWGSDICIPLGLDRASTNRSERDLVVAGVWKDNLSLKQATPSLEDLARRVEAQYRATNPEYAGLAYVPYDVRKGVVGDLRVALYVLMGAVALLLLITAANTANLLLARTWVRAREIGTRLALGASRARVARQFLTESVLLSAVSGLLGLLLGICALRPLLALIPAHYIGDGLEIHTSASALLLSFSMSLLLGVTFGVAPVVLISRRGVSENLGQSRTGLAADRRSSRVRASLVLSEVALAFLVATAAGLMFRSYRQITSIDLGFQPDHVLTMRVALPELKYRGSAVIPSFFGELLERVRHLPGVIDVAASSNRPMESDGAFRDFSIPGRSLNSAGGTATANYRVVTPSYFTVIRTPLHTGRFFTDQDALNAPGVVIVNERFAGTYFPNEDAVGKQIDLEERHTRAGPDARAIGRNLVQIVGVVRDSRHFGWNVQSGIYEPASPEIFVPLLQHLEDARDMALLLRTQTEPGSLTDAVRQQVLAIHADQPVFSIETLRAITDEALGPARLCLLLLGIFAGTALSTACIGLYAIVSYGVTQRAQEIGMRMVLGARRRDILRLVIREGLLAVTAGLAVGLVASFGASRIMSSLLYRVSTNDFATYMAVSATLIAIAALASYIPARRAMRVDPLVTLRYE